MKLGINGRFYAARRTTGIQRFARRTAAELCRLTDCVVLVPRGVSPVDAPDGALVRAGGLRGHWWEQLELPAAARRARCDVTVHLGSTAPWFGGPKVLTVHDVTPLTHPEWFRRRFAWWYRVALRGGARRADRLVTFSHWGRAEAARVLDVPPARVTVVPQGLAPLDGPASADAVRSVRERFRLPDRFLLATGAGDPRKNVSFLVELIRAWRPASAAPGLVVTGEPNPRVHPPVRPGTAPGVTWLGFVPDEDLRALYTGAVAFCYPSHREGFGRPPWEALACGTPVLTADFGPARELLGELAAVLPLEPERWQEEIERLVSDPEERVRRGERGRRAAAGLSWRACAEQILAVCREVADGVAPTGSAA